MGRDMSPAVALIHPTEPRIVAVLLGSCRRSANHSQIWVKAMTYYIDDGPESLSGLAGKDLADTRISDNRAFVESYCRHFAREIPAAFDRFVAFWVFRLSGSTPLAGW
jgi:hypothetical protein